MNRPNFHTVYVINYTETHFVSSRYSEVEYHYQSSRGVLDLKTLGSSVTPKHLDLVYKNPVRHQQPPLKRYMYGQTEGVLPTLV